MQRYWTCIGNKDLTFDERERIAEHIMQMTPKDLHKFAKKTLIQYPDGKLTIMTKSKNKNLHDDSQPLNFVTSDLLKAQLTTLNKPIDD